MSGGPRGGGLGRAGDLIDVARGPVSGAGQWVRRSVIAEAVELEVVGPPHEKGPTLIAANHLARVDRDVIASAWGRPVLGTDVGMRLGLASLIFPEGGISPDGSLGRFRARAFRPIRRMWKRGADVAIIPVAVTGTFGLDEGLPWWESTAARPRVTVRAGAPIRGFSGSAEQLAETVRDSVAALLAESESTWWQVRTEKVSPSVPPSPSWRSGWKRSDGSLAPGETPHRKIWQ